MRGSAPAELVRLGVGALRRSTLWWALGILALALVSVAFWPSLEGTSSLDQLMEASPDLMAAFGVQDLSTAAGYLDGQLYALLLPLLLSGFAVAGVSALTAGDEGAGRLELLHALPVGRGAVWLSRLVAALLLVALVTLLTAAAVALSLGPFSLDGVGVGAVVVATLACGALAAFHGAVAYAVAGAGGSRALAAGLAVAVLVAGYVANFLLPLSSALAGLQKASPWYWAIGTQPVTDGPPGWWVALLGVAVAVLVAVGTVAVGRRDIRNP